MSLVEARGLTKHFPLRSGFFAKDRRVVRAVDGVDLTIRDGETLGLVGESGCGKTTLGRLLLRLTEPTSGSIIFEGTDISGSKTIGPEIRRRMQMIFQDPMASLNPRKTVLEIVSLPLRIHGLAEQDELEEKVMELLEKVELTPPSLYVDRYPHEFSGGQRQRIVIARAIASGPRFIVADEPVSSLDLSVRAQILNLMRGLSEALGVTYLFISHDLSVVRSMCQRVAVMYLGKVVELAPVEELYGSPLHPYTKAILSATPVPNPHKSRSRHIVLLGGDPPSPVSPPSGCRFHPRCPFYTSQPHPRCASQEPPLATTGEGHLVACHQAS